MRTVASSGIASRWPDEKHGTGRCHPLLHCKHCSGPGNFEPLTRVGRGGLGAGVPTSGGDAITNMAQIAYQKNTHHVAIRGLVLHDLEGESNSTTTDMIGEIGLFYGRTRLLDWGRVTLAAGVAGIALDTCPDDDDSCFTFGVPFAAEISRGGSLVGLGVQAFANVNTKASYAGAVLFLQLGRLR
jgi:hypothetical protein